MKINIINSYSGVKKYIERVAKGEDKQLCWDEEVLSPHWKTLCCYAPFDLSDRKPSAITDIHELQLQCSLLEQLNMQNLEKEFERVATLLPNYDDDPITVVIFPGNPTNQTVNEKQNGVVGTSLFGNMYIEVNPLIEGYEEWIPYVFAHEYHHTVWGNYWFMLHGGELENKFIDSLIIDGEADSFALELYPTLKPKWLFDLSTEEMEHLWNAKYQSIVTQQNIDYPTYMFGSEDAQIPWCAGYAIGYWLVQKYLRQTNQSAIDILEIKPELLLEKLL